MQPLVLQHRIGGGERRQGVPLGHREEHHGQSPGSTRPVLPASPRRTPRTTRDRPASCGEALRGKRTSCTFFTKYAPTEQRLPHRGVRHAGRPRHDAVRARDVETVRPGQAVASAAVLLPAARTPGKRYALPCARAVLRQPSPPEPVEGRASARAVAPAYADPRRGRADRPSSDGKPAHGTLHPAPGLRKLTSSTLADTAGGEGCPSDTRRGMAPNDRPPFGVGSAPFPGPLQLRTTPPRSAERGAPVLVRRSSREGPAARS
ncbi:ATP-dependent Clp protease proteolytic subunit [Streptomyces cyslabdanicus]|uniref:ATP-dependent Clp protease proteolytic subunit n=1 Tax=Streptomyces cyslabdanicus TaxID=1470456 RepID=UPI0040442FC0